MRDTVIWKKLSCYSSEELERKITPLEDLSYTYFTADNLVLKLDKNRRNRLNTYIEKEELSEYEKFKVEEIKKLENVVQVIQDTLKDKINLFEYKENNNRTYASFELSKQLSVKDSTFIKSKINNEVFHLEIDDGNNSKTTNEIHLKS